MRALSKLRDGLVGAWCPSVGGWGGTILRDLSGQGNHGTLTNMDPATDWVVSGGKQALDFDGVNDYVDLTNAGNVIGLPNEMTYCAWVKPTKLNGTYQLFLTNDLSNGTGGYTLAIDSANAFYCAYGTGYQTANSAATLNDWFHVAATAKNVSGTKPKLYINGVENNLGASSNFTSHGSTGGLFLGRRQNGVYAQCQIDDVRIYNRALSESEIRLLASERGIGLRPERKRRPPRIQVAPTPAPPSNKIGTTKRRNKDRLRDGLVGAWCPSVSGWGGTILRDLSGQGNHGTLTNMDPATDWVVSGGKQALDFDGSNDVVTMRPGAITGTNPFTLSAWCQLNATPNFYQGVLMMGGGATGNSAWVGWVTAASVGTNNSWGGGGFGRNYGSGITDITGWHHIVLTSSGGASQTFSIFVDGIKLVTGTETITLTGTHLRIGANPTDAFTNGKIDDLRIYNRALSPDEIRLLASERGVGLRPERKRRLIQGPTFNAARLRRQSLIGSGVY